MSAETNNILDAETNNILDALDELKELGKTFGVSLTAATQTFNDARQYKCAVHSDENPQECASHYDAFYGADIEEANNQLENTMDEFDRKMEQWMKRFEGSPQTTNRRKVHKAMKTSPPPPPMSQNEFGDIVHPQTDHERLMGLVSESRQNIGRTIPTREQRNPYAPERQVGSIESHLNSELNKRKKDNDVLNDELMGLKKKYKNLEKDYSILDVENRRLREQNSTLRRANDTLGAKVAEYKQKLFSKKKKKENQEKLMKNVFGSIVQWFKE